MSTPPHAFASTPVHSNELWGDDWPEVRALWPLEPAVAHLNHGSFGAVPIAALDDQQSWRSRMEENPVRFFTRELDDALQQARLEVAHFFGADAESMAFVANATTAVSTVQASIELRPGDELVLTDHAYGAVRLAAERFARRAGASTRVARIDRDADEAQVITTVEGELSERTRLVIVDHVTSPTAWCMPVDALVAALRRRGVPVLVDAAHAPGMVDVGLGRDDGPDFWTGNLHKWCCAPRGTALLCVAPDWRERVSSLAVSWQDSAGFPGAFGVGGTADYTAWLAAPRALRTLSHLGWDRLRQHNVALATLGQERVAAAMHLDVGALPRDPQVSMQLVPLPDGVATTHEAAWQLQAGIAEHIETEVSVTTWRDRGYLRLSAQAYNAPGDFDRLCAHITELI